MKEPIFCTAENAYIKHGKAINSGKAVLMVGKRGIKQHTAIGFSERAWLCIRVGLKSRLGNTRCFTRTWSVYLDPDKTVRVQYLQENKT